MDETAVPDDDPAGPDPGVVTVRGALLGVGFVWLTAVSAFGAVQSAAYGALVDPLFVPVALLAGGVSVAAARAALRTFGYR